MKGSFFSDGTATDFRVHDVLFGRDGNRPAKRRQPPGWKRKGVLLPVLGGIVVSLLLCTSPLRGETPWEEEGSAGGPTRYGAALLGGNSYSPKNDIRLFMVSGFALFDYESIWRHKAPAPLRFKTEFALGGAAGSEHGFAGSAGIAALYYIDPLSGPSFRPYIEGGIGLVYTEFRVEGQGLHLNFNPQAGIGIEHKSGFFAAARLHHISNGGLDRDNRGVNSVVVMIGRFLK